MPGSKAKTRSAIFAFFAIISPLALPSLILGSVDVPPRVVNLLNLFLPMLYLGVPILAIYRVASAEWTKKLAVVFLMGGALTWGCFYWLEKYPLSDSTFGANAALAISQIGIETACVGLGAVLATMLPDKNLLIPIAIFLAAYDIFLVRTPVGFTHQLITRAPAMLRDTAVRVPAASAHHAGGAVAPNAFIGDADVVSLAAFFVAMFRFHLRPRETFAVMLPTLIVYLVVVVLFHVELPALLPMGAVFLIMNYREFRLTKDEKLQTGLIALLVCGLLTWGLTRPRTEQEPQPEPAPSVGAPAPQGSAQTPAPEAPGSHPSGSPTAPAGR